MSVRCNCCGAVYHTITSRVQPLPGTSLIDSLLGGGLGSALGGGFGGAAAQAMRAEAAYQRGGLQRALYSLFLNRAARLSWKRDVIEPHEDDDVREWRRREWNQGRYT